MTERTTTMTRVVHAVVYLALLVAGILYAFAGGQPFANVVSQEVVSLAGICTAIGSTTGLASVLTSRPWFEYLGLPLLIVGMAVFAFAAVVRIQTGDAASPVVSWVVVFIRVALIAFIVDRYVLVRRLIRGAS